MSIVGIVSAGHMGAGLGWALRAGGASVLSTVDGRSERTRKLAEAAGLTLVPTLADVVAAADIVLIVTPPGEALRAADAVGEAAQATGARPLVADLNAVSPSTMECVTAALRPLEVVDGSISGPPPTVRPGARVYFSGPRADELAALPWRHVQPIVLGDSVGLASALKMCTASVYKGLVGLYAQAIRAGAYHGVLDPVLADLRASGLDHTRSVAVAATKAHRYVAEMLEIAATQEAAGLTPLLFESLAQVYREIAGTPLADDDPESVTKALSDEEVAVGLNSAQRSSSAW
jgi:3-hydroxyisobutyrate dehydrogenase-like beta-hydroxyacid dehydrogenase